MKSFFAPTALKIWITLGLAAYFPVSFGLYFLFGSGRLGFIADIFGLPLRALIFLVLVPIWNMAVVPEGKGPGIASTPAEMYSLAGLICLIGLLALYLVSCIIAKGIQVRRSKI
ncbi:MAG: hypothetical protein WCJ29_05345 [bacterium]